jgi:surfactin synthase thioesterase subunit
MSDIEPAEGPLTVQPISPVAPGVTAELHRRHVTMHVVFDQELTSLQNSSPALPLTFFGICTGGAISFGAVVFTQKLPSSSHATFLALFVGAVALMLFFGARSVQAHQSTRKLLSDIRGREAPIGSSQ